MALGSKNLPKLHIFLGAGGVGKTTLSAGFALSLAKSGKKVGLLSIDPAKRLQTALGIDVLPELGARIQLPAEYSGELHAALLHIGESLKRWVREEGMSEQTQARLFQNNLFRAVADKLATSTDTFAAVRMAEWPSQFAQLDDLVIDTAPGIHAIDFLSKPEKLSSFLDSKLVDWLKWFVGAKDEKSNVFSRVMKSGARKVLDGLSQIGGQMFLLNFGEFLILLDEVFVTMMKRLEVARVWLKDPSTQFYIVTAVRDDAASVSTELGRTLKNMKLKARLVIINRAFPENLSSADGFVEFVNQCQEDTSDENLSARSFANHMSNFVLTQKRVKEQMAPFGEAVIELPVATQLDASVALRVTDLAFLGDELRLKAGTRVL